MALTFDELTAMKPRELDEVVKQGVTPDLKVLRGFEHRGYNVLLPHAHAVMWALSNVRFIKCFIPKEGEEDVAEPEELMGYNLKVTRGSKQEPWTCLPNDDKPQRIGLYKVLKPGAEGRGKDRVPQAVLLDYDLPENGLFDGRTLKDYLVQVEADNDALYLGKAYFHLGPLALPNHFIIERLQEHKR